MVPLVHIDNVQGNVRQVSSLGAVASEIASAHRTAGMIIKTTNDNKYYMYTGNNTSGFGTSSNWTELNTGTGGTGTGGTGASAYEI